MSAITVQLTAAVPQLSITFCETFITVHSF